MQGLDFSFQPTQKSYRYVFCCKAPKRQYSSHDLIEPFLGENVGVKPLFFRPREACYRYTTFSIRFIDRVTLSHASPTFTLSILKHYRFTLDLSEFLCMSYDSFHTRLLAQAERFELPWLLHLTVFKTAPL